MIRYGRPYGITYTEEVAGSSPVPPTIYRAVPKGQPPWCNLKVLCFPRFVLDMQIQAPLPERKRPRGRFFLFFEHTGDSQELSRPKVEAEHRSEDAHNQHVA